MCCVQNVLKNHLSRALCAQLVFHKNKEGKYHDPVTFKLFGPHSHIVAIRTSGNVYTHETVKQLNLETRNLKVGASHAFCSS